MLRTVGWIVVALIVCGFAIGVCVANDPYDPTQTGPTPAATYRRLSNPTVD